MVKWSSPRICEAQESPFVGVKTVAKWWWFTGVFLMYTLPETSSSHMKRDGWNISFLLGWHFFRCELLVSGDGLCTHVSQKNSNCNEISRRQGLWSVFAFFWSCVITYCKSSWDENSFLIWDSRFQNKYGDVIIVLLLGLGVDINLEFMNMESRNVFVRTLCECWYCWWTKSCTSW